LKKGLIGKWLTIILPLIFAGVLLFPTYRARTLESERQNLVNAKNDAALAAFDKEHGEDLRSAKEKQVKLGLDLRGGVYVTMEVDIVRLLEESAMRDAVDEIFLDVIAKTHQQVENTGEDDVIAAFRKNFDAIARPKGRSLFSYFDAGNSREVTEDAILKKLEKNSTEAVDQAMEVVRQRIDKYGVSEVTIQKQGSRRIVLELPGVRDEGEVRQLLQTTARLEFKLLRNNAEIVRAFYQIDQMLKAKKSGKVTDSTGVAVLDSAKTVAAKTDSTKAGKAVEGKTAEKGDSAKTLVAKADSTSKDSTKKDPYAGLTDEQKRKKFKEDYPFTSLFLTQFKNGDKMVPVPYEKSEFPEGEYFFQIAGESVPEFEAIIARPDVRRVLTNEYNVVLSAKPEPFYEKQGVKIFDIYGVKAEPELTGDVIAEAQATFDPTTNSPMVVMDMNADGADRWARITGANVKKRIAIVLDGRVYSAPTVQNKITGGRSQITGSSNIEEARLLEIVLKAGALKAPIKIVEERVVGPSLGEDSIRTGLLSSGIAALLVIIFMLVYYVSAGVIADLAVMLNIILVVAALAAFGGTLTLPGIAGLILTLGMAVDVNILIYERIREELSHGRSLRSAVDVGFSRALNAIIDSNVTSTMTGIILYYLGTGPIKGFAVTLIIGIVMTLFTGVMVSRAIFELVLMSGATSFNLGQPQVATND
jgi:preprotein translocase subunit SecD